MNWDITEKTHTHQICQVPPCWASVMCKGSLNKKKLNESQIKNASAYKDIIIEESQRECKRIHVSNVNAFSSGTEIKTL